MSDSTANDFDALRRLLERHGIDLSRWHPPDASTVEALFEEVKRGECEITPVPLMRRLTILRLLINEAPEGRLLWEEKILHNDKRVQHRNAPPSEKMRADEPLREAVARALEEELSLSPGQFRILSIASPREEQRASSGSYPGLRSHYKIFDVHLSVTGLPKGNFVTEENSGPGAASRHHWRWVESTPENRLAVPVSRK